MSNVYPSASFRCTLGFRAGPENALQNTQELEI